jgi:hypothetical protein
MTTDLAHLETVAAELLTIFDVSGPPVPIEYMLQHPRAHMWEEVDISLVSGSFLNLKVPYMPRMSLTRVLVRLVVNSEWGMARGLGPLALDAEAISTLARTITMPRSMVQALPPGARTPHAMSEHFEVPVLEAEKRLGELASLG